MSNLLVRAQRVTPSSWLVAHGDSITAGASTLGTDTTNGFAYLVAQVAGSADVNYGIAGQGLNYASNTAYGTLTADAVTRVDPLLASLSGSKRLIIFGGTNDIFLAGTSGAATATLLQSYVAARISAGWTAGNICVCTMLPRQGQHESDRTTLNTSIRNNAAGVGYIVADLAANATIGAAGADSNTTYYADGIHPTVAGHALIASIIEAAFP